VPPSETAYMPSFLIVIINIAKQYGEVIYGYVGGYIMHLFFFFVV